ETVIDVGDFHPGVDGLAPGFQCEIQIDGLVWLAVVSGVRRRVRRLKAFEDVVVDFDTVSLLAGGRSQLRERLEPLRLRLRVVSERRRFGANPRVVLFDSVVAAE